MDGRDVPPDSGLVSRNWKSALRKSVQARLQRYRGVTTQWTGDNRWEREEKAYDAIVYGRGETASDAVSAMQQSYDAKVVDEFVLPTVVLKDGAPTATLKANDAVIFFNFRPDRARQLTRAITEPDFDGFKRDWFETYFVTMTQYDKTFSHVHVAFKPETLKNTLGEYLAKCGKKQFRIARRRNTRM